MQVLLGQYSDEQAAAAVRQGAGAAWEYIQNPENWPYLLGAATPEEREALAQAYETGDSRAVGRLLGEAIANAPIASGGLGTIKRVDKVVGGAEDAAKAAAKSSSPVDIGHTIGADYNPHTKRVTGGHTLLNNDVRIVEIVSPPDANGVYIAKVEIKAPDGSWVEKITNNGRNTMFPQNWDAARIQAEIESAWARRTDIEGKSKMWKGISDSGIEIQGYKEPRATAYPTYKEK